ncbi:MAG: DNRLRE domain-containing protein [Pirellula sp.]
MYFRSILKPLLVLMAWQWNSMLYADIASFSASRDNTLYESATGALSNGAGNFLFSGRTTNSGLIRRGLLQFDTSSIPIGATINSVSVRLTMDKADQAGQVIVGLNRMTRQWGEGTSLASGQEGGGAAATNGDATWLHSSFPGTLWTTAGGDFVATASATQTLSAEGNYTWNSTVNLVADVQQWVNNPTANFGWMLRGEEIGTTAMRFVSRTGPGGVAVRPQLTVDFTAVPEPGSVLLLASAGMLILLGWRRTHSAFHHTVARFSET